MKASLYSIWKQTIALLVDHRYRRQQFSTLSPSRTARFWRLFNGAIHLVCIILHHSRKPYSYTYSGRSLALDNIGRSFCNSVYRSCVECELGYMRVRGSWPTDLAGAPRSEEARWTGRRHASYSYHTPSSQDRRHRSCLSASSNTTQRCATLNQTCS